MRLGLVVVEWTAAAAIAFETFLVFAHWGCNISTVVSDLVGLRNGCAAMFRSIASARDQQPMSHLIN